jgi:hypothetical protein
MQLLNNFTKTTLKELYKQYKNDSLQYKIWENVYVTWTTYQKLKAINIYTKNNNENMIVISTKANYNNNDDDFNNVINLAQ